MIPLQHDLKEFLRLLSVHHVKYLLIGAYAVGYHGYARSTADMDIWVETSPANAMRIVETLESIGFGGTNVNPDRL